MKKLAIKKLNIFQGAIAFVLGCLISICLAVPVHAAETSGVCGDGLSWIFSNGTLTITGSGDMKDYTESDLPPWHSYAEEIQSVSFPSEMESVGDLAFYGCSNLSTVNLPSETISIGDFAFLQCTNLTRVNLGGNLERIGEGAFRECENLSMISFPKTLKSIGTKAFYRCYQLRTITIPTSVEHMGVAVFAYNTGLVRAIVNANLEKIPDWTFYGCTSLTDISLSAEITTVGGYCFKNCDSLQGVYTQSKDSTVAYELNKSFNTSENGGNNSFVAEYDMPNSSISSREEGDRFVEQEVTETIDTTIVVETVTDNSKTDDKKTTTIQTVLDNNSGWRDLASKVEEVLSNGKAGNVETDIQLIGNKVEGSYLALFAGKDIVLQITTDSGVIWKIDMSRREAKDFRGTYNLEVEMAINNSEDVDIQSSTIYSIKFLGDIDFDVTVGLPIGSYFQIASLYQKGFTDYERLASVVVDGKGYSWYNLADISPKTDFYIGMNVEGYDNVGEAVIPNTMQEQMGFDESTLTGEDGTQYMLSGRTSRWGITGTQFAIYVAVAIGAVVLIVSIVMIYLNKMKANKEKYQDMARASKEKDHEEKLRIEIMRELLGKKDKEKDSGEDK